MNKAKIMSKKKIIIFSVIICVAIIATFYFLGCNRTTFEKESNTTGQSTVKQTPTDGSTPIDHSALDNAAYALYELNQYGSFVGESSGSSTAVGVKQAVKSKRVILGDEVYKQSVAYSFAKNVGVETYVKGDNYVIRDAASVKSVDDATWKDTAQRVSYESFIAKFGSVSNEITAYIISEETVLSAELVSEADGLFSFKYTLDPSLQKSTGKIANEMRTMAGTETLPVFERVSITITMDSSWKVVRTETDCKYKVDMFGGVDCVESIVENITAHGENTPIPNAEFFEPYLEAEISDVSGFERDAMYYLTNGFNAYAAGNPLNAAITVDGAIAASMRASVNIDIAHPENIGANIAIDELKYGDISIKNIFASYRGGKIYLKYGDLYAVTDIDEIMGLVSRFSTMLGKEVSLGGIAVDGLLANATLASNGGIATVTLPIELGGISLVAALDFTENNPTFIGGSATVGENITISIAQSDAARVDFVEGNYLPIATVLDIIDKDNNICLEVAVAGQTALVNVNLATLEVDAKIGRLKAKFVDGVVYISFGDLKARVATSELGAVVEKLAPLFGEGSALGALVKLPTMKIDLKTALASAISSLTAVETEGVLSLSLALAGVNASVNLAAEETGYRISGITLGYGDITATATSAVSSTLDKIKDEELGAYKNALTLLDIIDKNAVNVSVGIGSVAADLNIDLMTLTVKAAVQISGKTLYAEIANGRAYINFLGLKVYADIDNLKDLMTRFAPLLSRAGLNLDGLKLESIDFAKVLTSLTAVADPDTGVVSLGADLLGQKLAIALSSDEKGWKIASAAVSGSISATVTFSKTAADYSAIAVKDGYYNVMGIVDLIDADGNIPLTATVGKTKIDLTFNIYSLRLNAAVSGVNITLDLDSKTAYVVAGGARVSVKLADAKGILGTLKPILDKFVPAMASTDLTALLGSVNVGSILSGITVEDKDGVLTLSMKVGEDVKADVAFDVKSGKLDFKGAVVAFGKTSIAAEKSAVVVSDVDMTAAYIDLAKLVEAYGDSLTKLVLAENISVSLGGSIVLSGKTLRIDTGKVVVGGIGGDLKVNAELALSELAEDGSLKKAHTVRLVYLSAIENTHYTVDEAGAVTVLKPNAYFNYNGLEGTFSTANLNETIAALKQIYANIPELQAVIGGMITLPSEGDIAAPTIDIAKIITSLVMDGEGKITAGINGKSAMAALPESIAITLAPSADGIAVGIEDLALMGITISVTANASAVTAEDITGAFDYTVGANASDFTSINDLLRTFATTSQYRHFNLSGNLDLAVLGFINIDDKVKLDIKIDVVDGITYVKATLTREHVALVQAWRDYEGASTLYYDGSNEMIYIRTDYYKIRKIIGITTRGDKATDYAKYTVDEFKADALTIILDILRLNSTYEDMITKESGSDESSGEMSIESLFKSYSYDGTSNFNIKVNLASLTSALGDVNLVLTHDETDNLTALALDTTISGLLTIKFSATHNAPYNNDNGIVSEVVSQATLKDSSGNLLY